MTKSSALRVAPTADGVSIWSDEIFGDPRSSSVREFLARAFSVPEVQRVELRRAAAFGRIRFGTAERPAQLWKKIGDALRTPIEPRTAKGAAAVQASGIDASLLYLEGPAAQVRVTRIGRSLTTWRVRRHAPDTVQLWHPLLRTRRELIARVEQELGTILGVDAFRTSALTGAIEIRFDRRTLTIEHLARTLEQAWPQLLDNLDGAPSRTRLSAASSLLGLSLTARFAAPALRPFALAGMAVYSFPNVIRASRQLARGNVGVYTLYSTGLAFMLLSGSPLAASLMATLMQAWPQLGRRKAAEVQRRLFAEQRRRPARVHVLGPDGESHERDLDAVRAGDRVLVQRGEVIAVDGIVEAGYAVVAGAPPFGGDRLEDRAKGDAVLAGARVTDGSMTLVVERAGAQTLASQVDALLREGAQALLPSHREVERIADRNARPALAAAGLALLVTRRLRLSQALIRPDYVTAPRLSAQLSALHAFARGLQRGAVFRNPSAVDRVAQTDVYVFDESANLDQRRLEVDAVDTAGGVSPQLLVAYALAAREHSAGERARALAAFVSKRRIVLPKADAIERSAGVTRYHDRKGRVIEIATAEYVASSRLELPPPLCAALPAETPDPTGQPLARTQQTSASPLWVLRDGSAIGRVSFARTGEPVGRAVLAALRAKDKRASIVYLSASDTPQARARAAQLGIEGRFGLSREQQREWIAGLGQRALWIGEGSAPGAKQVLAASAVSISVGSFASAQPAADIELPQRGLDGLIDVMAICRAHSRRLKQDYRTVYTVNLLAVAGALLARFSGLHAGLLSNFGTALVYARHARELSSLVSVTERRRVRLLRTSSLDPLANGKA